MRRRLGLRLSVGVAFAAASLACTGVAAARVTAGPPAGPSGDVRCSGIQSSDVARNLIVPAGATCTITHGTTIGHDVTVGPGATLIDSAGDIGHDIVANRPKGIGIGGFLGQAGTVGHSIQINGTTGLGPGTVTGGDNYICHTQIGGNVMVQGTSAGAGQWIIGDQDEECSGGGDLIGGNLAVTGNAVRVDVADNRAGSPPYAEGIDSNLVVQGNLTGTTFPVVESNFVGRNASCQAGTVEDSDGSPNTVQGTNNGCP